jgi:diguanylate cyclase (GGDEF)-like protein
MFKKPRNKPTPPQIEEQAPPQFIGGSNLLEPLLGVHVSRDTGWLADACSTAAERGLGALYCILYLTDSAGLLAGQRPTSTDRVRRLARLHEQAGNDLTELRFRATDRAALSNAILDGHASNVRYIGEALPLDDSPALHEAQRGLGIGEVWLAPLYWDGEGVGVLVLFMPAGTNAPLAEAELLGRHAAVAFNNMRDLETGRKWGELDAVRWVYDEQRFLSQLRAEIRRAERHDRPLSVLFVRVEDISGLRSRYGKFLTEGLLRQLGAKFAEAKRDTDFLGAYQEDGFATILVEADDGGAQIAQDRLLESLESINLPDATLPDLQLQLNCVTVTLNDDGKTAEELAAAAEERLQQQAENLKNVA